MNLKIKMNLTDILDKVISIIVWNTEKEDDVQVFRGKLQIHNRGVFFVNEEQGWRVSLHEEQLSRLKSVPGELKETLLNSDYALSLSMGEFPQFKFREYQRTGMKWDC